MIEVEFTDRYGGNPPSWLRGCHDDCEAMGYVPIFQPIEGGSGVAPVDPDARYRDAWLTAHEGETDLAPGEECNGWHFVECLTCQGSGRVLWFTSIRRIPRWLVKGGRFAVSAPHAPWMSRRANYWLIVKCAWLYDLGWPRSH